MTCCLSNGGQFLARIAVRLLKPSSPERLPYPFRHGEISRACRTLDISQLSLVEQDLKPSTHGL